MIIRYNDKCQKCGKQADDHTYGVFYPNEEAPLERVLAVGFQSARKGSHPFQLPNLKYLEWKYENSIKQNTATDI